MQTPTGQFLESLGANAPSTDGVCRQVLTKIKGLPLGHGHDVDQTGASRLFGWIAPTKIEDEVQKALTVRFLADIASQIVTVRPMTGLSIMSTISRFVATETLEATSRKALDVYLVREPDLGEVMSLISYAKEASARYRDQAWPTDSLDLLYLVAIAAEGLDAHADRSHSILETQHESLSSTLNVYGGLKKKTWFEFFRPLADAPQRLLEAGEITPDQALRRAQLGNRFFKLIVDSGHASLTDDKGLLVNAVRLINDIPETPDRISSLASVYDSKEFRTDLAHRCLCNPQLIISMRIYPLGDLDVQISDFSDFTEKVKSLVDTLTQVEGVYRWQENAFSNLMVAIANASVRRGLPKAMIHECLDLVFPHVSLPMALELSNTEQRRVISDFVVCNHLEQAKHLDHETRSHQFSEDLGL